METCLEGSLWLASQGVLSDALLLLPTPSPPLLHAPAMKYCFSRVSEKKLLIKF